MIAPSASFNDVGVDDRCRYQDNETRGRTQNHQSCCRNMGGDCAINGEIHKWWVRKEEGLVIRVDMVS